MPKLTALPSGKHYVVRKCAEENGDHPRGHTWDVVEMPRDVSVENVDSRTQARKIAAERNREAKARRPAPLTTFTSAAGRTFTIGDGAREERFPGDVLWSDTFPITYEGKPAGKLFCNDNYGRTADGKPRWQASTRDLWWRRAVDAPVGVGFDVAAFDTAEDAVKAWARSADQILDWSEGKPVASLFAGIVRKKVAHVD